MGINLIHPASLVAPIIQVILLSIVSVCDSRSVGDTHLHNTEAVNPDIAETKPRRNIDGILMGLRQGFPRNTCFVGGE